MTEDDIRDLVRQRGPQNHFARQAGVDPAAISLFMTGARGPGPALLTALGLRKVVTYEKADCNPETESA